MDTVIERIDTLESVCYKLCDTLHDPGVKDAAKRASTREKVKSLLEDHIAALAAAARHSDSFASAISASGAFFAEIAGAPEQDGTPPKSD